MNIIKTEKTKEKFSLNIFLEIADIISVYLTIQLSNIFYIFFIFYFVCIVYHLR